VITKVVGHQEDYNTIIIFLSGGTSEISRSTFLNGTLYFLNLSVKAGV